MFFETTGVGDTWNDDTWHMTHVRELVAGETHVGHMASHVSICMRGDWCMALEMTCVIHMACHVEVKWLKDWLYIWTSSSIPVEFHFNSWRAPRRKGKGRREKKERKERERRKEGRKEKEEEKKK